MTSWSAGCTALARGPRFFSVRDRCALASPRTQDSEFSRIDEDFEAEQASLISARKAASFLSSSEQVGSPTSDLNVQRASELGGGRSDAR